jgi:hypothetical protein
MNSYLFEIYERKEKENIFKGYRRVPGESTESAKLSVQEVVGNNFIVVQIHDPLP